MFNVRVKIIVLDSAAEFGVPKYATPGSAGFDLVATEDVLLNAFSPCAVATGLKMAIPEGYELQVRPRSGLSLKNICIVNSPGTIDSDYRGEIKVLMAYMGPSLRHDEHGNLVSGYKIERGDKIAQGVISPVHQAKFDVVGDLDSTARGEGGFGSTGSSVLS